MSATHGAAVEARDPLPELKLADVATVKGRKRVSAFSSSFSAVVSRWGLAEACRELNAARPKAKDKVKPSEIMRLCLVMVEAAQRVEWLAEQQAAGRGEPQYSERRRFRASASTLEMFYRREQMPPELRGDDRKADRQRYLESLARAFRRRWAKLEAVQRFLHVALFEREEGEATATSKKAPTFTDYLSDLIVQTARRSAELRGEPVGRYNRAADEVLASFRASRPPYAPEWEMPAPAGSTAEGGDGEVRDPFKVLRALVDGAADDACAILAELRAAGMTEADEQREREALIARFSQKLSEFSDAPRGGPGGGAARVSPNADTIPPRSSARVSTRTNLSGFAARGSLDLAGNSQKGGAEVRQNVRGLSDAEAACAVAASVGAERVQVLLLDDAKRDGEEGFCRHAETLTLARFQDKLPYFLARSGRESLSVSVRLRCKKGSYGLHFLQVDDCDPEQLERLAPFAFWTVRTSATGKPQAWLAFSERLTFEQHASVRRRLMRALNPGNDAAAANSGAGGAIRWPGSANCKPSRRLEDGTFPRVEIVAASLGRTVTVAELDDAGLLALPEPETVTVAPPPNVLKFDRRGGGGPREFPVLDEYLARHRKENGEPDRSRAEFAWCMAALKAGWSEVEVEIELSRITQKGRGRRDGYVSETVRNAARRLGSLPSGRAQRRERVAI